MNLNDAELAKAELARAVEGGDQEDIAATAMFHIWPLVMAHIDLLIGAVAVLQAPVLDRCPVLRLVHPFTAVLARTTRPFTPRLYPDEAKTMSAEEVDMVMLTQLIAFRASGDIESALVYARRLHERMQTVRVESRDRIDGPRWYFDLQIGSTLLVAGEPAKALRSFAMARQLGALSPQEDAERVALGRIAVAHAVRGSLEDAARALAAARALPPPMPTNRTLATTTEVTTAALIAVDRGANDVDERLAELSPHDSVDLMWPFALLARTRSLLARRLPDDALETIRLARDSHPVSRPSFAFDVVGGATIEALLQTDELDQARRVAREYEGAGLLTELATVRLLLREHAPDAASAELIRLRRDPSLGPGARIECEMLGVWADYLREGDLDAVMADQLFRVMRQRDHRRLAAGVPRQVVECAQERLAGESAREFADVRGSIQHAELGERPMLTSGERRALEGLTVHASTAAMAAAFQVSPNTIKSQLRTLYRKLGCSTREEALRAAERLHLLTPDEE